MVFYAFLAHMKGIVLISLVIQLFSVVFWNLENYFDYSDSGGGPSDTEFSPHGAKRWTRKRFDRKTALIAKTILWSGAPPVVGVAEVENRFVLQHLVKDDILRKFHYSFVHFESADHRGIDVGMLYRTDSFTVHKAWPIRLGNVHTRDILYVCLKERSSGTLWHFFVNHHPSKFSGNAATSSLRKQAMTLLRSSVDSLLAAGQTNIVAMGDFNDSPYSEAFTIVEGSLVNLGMRMVNEASNRNNCGSIRYRGKWELIDNFLISKQLDTKIRMETLRPPFLMEQDRSYPGEKPKRTFTGPRYNGGVSDHCPVKLTVVH